MVAKNTSRVRTKFFKWYQLIIAGVPLLAMLATVSMWVDTRYMHKEVSDIRYIELQIRVIESQIKLHKRMEEAGETLSVEDKLRYEMDMDQLKNLMMERNKVLGIGDQE